MDVKIFLSINYFQKLKKKKLKKTIEYKLCLIRLADIVYYIAIYHI